MALLLLLVLLLRGVAASDRAGVGTLGHFSGLVRLLALGGLAIQDAFGRHLALLRVLLVAAAAAGAFVLVRTRRATPKRDLPVLCGIALLALSASFLPAAPLVAVLLGAAGGAALVLVPPRESDGPPWSGVWLALPLGIGILLRFWALEAVPEGYSEHAVVHHVSLSLPYKDALFALLGAGKFREAAGTAWEWIVREHFGLMSLLAAAGFEAFGVSQTISRAFSAATGTLAVLCAYFCGRNLFDRRVGLAFAWLLAVCPWHLAASRYGDLEHVLATLQLLLALALYAAALRRGRTLDWILAGGALGFSWFVYASNQVLPVIVGLHLLFMLAFRGGFLRRSGWRVLLFSAVFAALSASTLAAIARGGILMPNRGTGYQNGQPIPVAQFARNVQMTEATLRQVFVHVNDPWFTKPGGGLSVTEETLLVPGVLLCLAGLFVRETRWASALVLTGLPLSLLPGILGPDPSFRRIYPAAILALLLAAVVLVRGFDGLRALGVPRAVLAGAGAAFAAALALVNAHVYFDVVRVEAENSCRYYTAMSREMRKVLGTEFVYVYVPAALPHEDHHRYIRLEAYATLERLSREGRSAADLYEVVSGPGLLDALRAPRRIAGRFRILTEAALLNSRGDGMFLHEAIRTGLPGAREEDILGSDGTPLVRTWRLP